MLSRRQLILGRAEMDIHENARLTPRGRERLVRMVLSGQTPQAAGEAVGVCKPLQQPDPLHQLWPVVLHVADLGADLPGVDRAGTECKNIAHTLPPARVLDSKQNSVLALVL